LLGALQLKHIFRWMGCIAADRRTIEGALARGSLGIIPEGVAGIFQGANRCAKPPAHGIEFSSSQTETHL